MNAYSADWRRIMDNIIPSRSFGVIYIYRVSRSKIRSRPPIGYLKPFNDRIMIKTVNYISASYTPHINPHPRPSHARMPAPRLGSEPHIVAGIGGRVVNRYARGEC